MAYAGLCKSNAGLQIMPIDIAVQLTVNHVGSDAAQLLATALATLARLEFKLGLLLTKEELMSLNVQKLVDAVAAETTVENSIIALLGQVVQQNKDLAKQLADAIAANDPAALAAVQKAIDDSTVTIQDNITRISAAVTTNTQ